MHRRGEKASPRLKMSPELAVWVSGGKLDRVLRVDVERRGAEEDSKQGEELKLSWTRAERVSEAPASLYKYEC